MNQMRTYRVWQMKDELFRFVFDHQRTGEMVNLMMNGGDQPPVYKQMPIELDRYELKYMKESNEDLLMVLNEIMVLSVREGFPGVHDARPLWNGDLIQVDEAFYHVSGVGYFDLIQLPVKKTV